MPDALSTPPAIDAVSIVAATRREFLALRGAEGVRVIDAGQQVSKVATDLGLRPHPLVAATSAERVELSPEELGRLVDVDVLLVAQFPAEDSLDRDDTALNPVTSSPLWRGLPAVVDGRVVTYDAELFPASPPTAPVPTTALADGLAPLTNRPEDTMSLLLDHPPITDATRREFLTGLAAAGLLTACGTDRPAGPTGSAPGFPRTVEHSGGTVTLDGPPQRVFLSDTRANLDDLLALGIVPVAVANASSEAYTRWSLERGIGDAVRIDRDRIDVETLAAEQVDLFLIAQYLVDDGVAARLEPLAPVVVLPDLDTTPGRLPLFGRLFGREDAAAAIVAERAERIAAWRPPRPVGSLTVFFAIPDGGVNVYLPGTGAMAAVLDELGVPLLDRGMPGEFGFTLSEEELGRLDSDLILSVAPYPGDAPALDAIEAGPVFRAVPAVRDGRYTRLSTEESQALLAMSSLSTPIALDALTRVLSP